VARDRQKAKQRKARRAGAPGREGPSAPQRPHRDNVPPDWEHASGEVDRFEAELITGAGAAGGDDPDAGAVTDAELDDAALEHTGDLDDDGDVDDDDRALAVGAAAGRGGRSGGNGGGRAVARAGGRPHPEQPTRGGIGIGRFGAFLRASWAELQRVQWPDRAQVGQATAVVIGFVLIAGAYLGLADAVAKAVVNFILGTS
jgi:preprotein translocase subunit SecE